jgi:hypothetical protein
LIVYQKFMSQTQASDWAGGIHGSQQLVDRVLPGEYMAIQRVAVGPVLLGRQGLAIAIHQLQPQVQLVAFVTKEEVFFDRADHAKHQRWLGG